MAKTLHSNATARMAKRAALAGGILAAGCALGAGAALALRHRIFTSCKSFYSKASKPFRIPGIDKGFVPQDMFYLEKEGLWLFSGYSVRHNKPSPIYLMAEDGSVRHVTIELPDGEIYCGHGAAVTAYGDYAFLTVKDGYVVLDRNALVAAADGSTLKAFAHVPAELEPAFMTVQNNTLYIGEFYHPHFYPTPRSHRVKLPDGTENPALIYAYRADDAGMFGFAGQATAVYSIPADVQGMCVTSDGRMVLSRSWGFGDAHMPIYDMSKAEARGTYIVDGHEAPLYVLDGHCLVKVLTVPPMSEGIDYRNGRVFLPNESASNLYLFGKVFGGRNVYSFAV